METEPRYINYGKQIWFYFKCNGKPLVDLKQKCDRIWFLLYFFKRFYLFIHERHRERQRHMQREKQTPCGEPDAGLNPRAPGSRPELKADAQPLSHVGAPLVPFSFPRLRDTEWNSACSLLVCAYPSASWASEPSFDLKTPFNPKP